MDRFETWLSSKLPEGICGWFFQDVAFTEELDLSSAAWTLDIQLGLDNEECWVPVSSAILRWHEDSLAFMRTQSKMCRLSRFGLFEFIHLRRTEKNLWGVWGLKGSKIARGPGVSTQPWSWLCIVTERQIVALLHVTVVSWVFFSPRAEVPSEDEMNWGWERSRLFPAMQPANLC